MTQHFTISDDLLSAYIDRQVNEAEIARVEKALAADPTVQQQLQALQATIHLLHDAPAAVPPRAFTLSEADVMDARKTPASSFWARWLPRLMPAATAVVAVLFILSLLPAIHSKEMLAVPQVQSVAEEMPASAPLVNKEVEVTRIVEKAVAKSVPQATGMAASSSTIEEARSVSQTTTPPQAPANDNAVALSATTEDCDSDAPHPESTDEGICLPDELSATAFDSAKPAPVAPAARPRTFALTPWLLGSLLLILLLLTWKISIIHPRQR